MVKNAIKIYGRIKPVERRKDAGYFIQEGATEDALFVQLKDAARDPNDDQHRAAATAELNQFRFYKVFDQHVRQNEIFTSVAKPIVDSVLQGYNGTVFAYGQTGSGKTFTVTGGPDDYDDRGLIPRAIEYVFRRIATTEGSLYTMCITYLQIYNEAAYDLLGQHAQARLEDLPRLVLLDDTDGYLHIRNLSLHPVATEHEALNLLFLGDTNRAIAETPMNQASSRSHCMFTLHLAVRKGAWKSARRAKLHFVDLAGSERVHKRGGAKDGRTLSEARHINLSLHYLEQVITALSESKRTHVPYRNCVITTMLRDSIGGNCLTSMVATLSLDKHHLPVSGDFGDVSLRATGCTCQERCDSERRSRPQPRGGHLESGGEAAQGPDQSVNRRQALHGGQPERRGGERVPGPGERLPERGAGAGAAAGPAQDRVLLPAAEGGGGRGACWPAPPPAARGGVHGEAAAAAQRRNRYSHRATSKGEEEAHKNKLRFSKEIHEPSNTETQFR